MSITIIFKIAAVGIIVAVISQVLKELHRDAQALVASLAGLVVVLLWVIPLITELFQKVQTLFAL